VTVFTVVGNNWVTWVVFSSCLHVVLELFEVRRHRRNTSRHFYHFLSSGCGSLNASVATLYSSSLRNAWQENAKPHCKVHKQAGYQYLCLFYFNR